MRLKRTPFNQRGSTLIESLVAVGLYGLAMAAIGNLLITHMRMDGKNFTQTTAIGLAERELEDLRSIDYSDIMTRTSSQTITGIPYTVTTTVTPDVPAANMKTINTTVTWTDRTGAQSYALNAVYTAVKR